MLLIDLTARSFSYHNNLNNFLLRKITFNKI